MLSSLEIIDECENTAEEDLQRKLHRISLNGSFQRFCDLEMDDGAMDHSAMYLSHSHPALQCSQEFESNPFQFTSLRDSTSSGPVFESAFEELEDWEKDQILQVMSKEEAMEQEINSKLSRLRAELTALRRRGAIKVSAESNGSMVELGRSCTRCRSQLGRIINRGAICRNCKERVCKSCREYSASRSGQDWLCVICHKANEIAGISGEWVNEFIPNNGKKGGGKLYVPSTAELLKRNIRRSWTISNPSGTVGPQMEPRAGNMSGPPPPHHPGGGHLVRHHGYPKPDLLPVMDADEEAEVLAAEGYGGPPPSGGHFAAAAAPLPARSRPVVVAQIPPPQRAGQHQQFDRPVTGQQGKRNVPVRSQSLGMADTNQFYPKGGMGPPRSKGQLLMSSDEVRGQRMHDPYSPRRQGQPIDLFGDASSEGEDAMMIDQDYYRSWDRRTNKPTYNQLHLGPDMKYASGSGGLDRRAIGDCQSLERRPKQRRLPDVPTHSLPRPNKQKQLSTAEPRNDKPDTQGAVERRSKSQESGSGGGAEHAGRRTQSQEAAAGSAELTGRRTHSQGEGIGDASRRRLPQAPGRDFREPTPDYDSSSSSPRQGRHHGPPGSQPRLHTPKGLQRGHKDQASPKRPGQKYLEDSVEGERGSKGVVPKPTRQGAKGRAPPRHPLNETSAGGSGLMHHHTTENILNDLIVDDDHGTRVDFDDSFDSTSSTNRQLKTSRSTVDLTELSKTRLRPTNKQHFNPNQTLESDNNSDIVIGDDDGSPGTKNGSVTADSPGRRSSGSSSSRRRVPCSPPRGNDFRIVFISSTESKSEGSELNSSLECSGGASAGDAQPVGRKRSLSGGNAAQQQRLSASAAEKVLENVKGDFIDEQDWETFKRRKAKTVEQMAKLHQQQQMQGKEGEQRAALAGKAAVNRSPHIFTAGQNSPRPIKAVKKPPRQTIDKSGQQRNSPKTFLLDDFSYVGNLNGEESGGDRRRHPSSPSIRTILTTATKDSDSIPPSPRMPKIHNIHIRREFDLPPRPRSAMSTTTLCSETSQDIEVQNILGGNKGHPFSLDESQELAVYFDSTLSGSFDKPLDTLPSLPIFKKTSTGSGWKPGRKPSVGKTSMAAESNRSSADRSLDEMSLYDQMCLRNVKKDNPTVEEYRNLVLAELKSITASGMLSRSLSESDLSELDGVAIAAQQDEMRHHHAVLPSHDQNVQFTTLTRNILNDAPLTSTPSSTPTSVRTTASGQSMKSVKYFAGVRKTETESPDNILSDSVSTISPSSTPPELPPKVRKLQQHAGGRQAAASKTTNNNSAANINDGSSTTTGGGIVSPDMSAHGDGGGATAYAIGPPSPGSRYSTTTGEGALPPLGPNPYSSPSILLPTSGGGGGTKSADFHNNNAEFSSSVLAAATDYSTYGDSETVSKVGSARVVLKTSASTGLGRSASSVGQEKHVITKPLRRSKSQLPGNKYIANIQHGGLVTLVNLSDEKQFHKLDPDLTQGFTARGLGRSNTTASLTQGSNTLPRAGHLKRSNSHVTPSQLESSEIVITKKLSGSGSSVRIRIGGPARSPTSLVESRDNWKESQSESRGAAKPQPSRALGNAHSQHHNHKKDAPRRAKNKQGRRDGGDGPVRARPAVACLADRGDSEPEGLVDDAASDFDLNSLVEGIVDDDSEEERTKKAAKSTLLAPIKIPEASVDGDPDEDEDTSDEELGSLAVNLGSIQPWRPSSVTEADFLDKEEAKALRDETSTSAKRVTNLQRSNTDVVRSPGHVARAAGVADSFLARGGALSRSSQDSESGHNAPIQPKILGRFGGSEVATSPAGQTPPHLAEISDFDSISTTSASYLVNQSDLESLSIDDTQLDMLINKPDLDSSDFRNIEELQKNAHLEAAALTHTPSPAPSSSTNMDDRNEGQEPTRQCNPHHHLPPLTSPTGDGDGQDTRRTGSADPARPGRAGGGTGEPADLARTVLALADGAGAGAATSPSHGLLSVGDTTQDSEDGASTLSSGVASAKSGLDNSSNDNPQKIVKNTRGGHFGGSDADASGGHNSPAGQESSKSAPLINISSAAGELPAGKRSASGRAGSVFSLIAKFESSAQDAHQRSLTPERRSLTPDRSSRKNSAILGPENLPQQVDTVPAARQLTQSSNSAFSKNDSAPTTNEGGTLGGGSNYTVSATGTIPKRPLNVRKKAEKPLEPPLTTIGEKSKSDNSSTLKHTSINNNSGQFVSDDCEPLRGRELSSLDIAAGTTPHEKSAIVAAGDSEKKAGVIVDPKDSISSANTRISENDLSGDQSLLADTETLEAGAARPQDSAADPNAAALFPSSASPFENGGAAAAAGELEDPNMPPTIRRNSAGGSAGAGGGGGYTSYVFISNEPSNDEVGSVVSTSSGSFTDSENRVTVNVKDTVTHVPSPNTCIVSIQDGRTSNISIVSTESSDLNSPRQSPVHILHHGDALDRGDEDGPPPDLPTKLKLGAKDHNELQEIVLATRESLRDYSHRSRGGELEEFYADRLMPEPPSGGLANYFTTALESNSAPSAFVSRRGRPPVIRAAEKVRRQQSGSHFEYEDETRGMMIDYSDHQPYREGSSTPVMGDEDDLIEPRHVGGRLDGPDQYQITEMLENRDLLPDDYSDNYEEEYDVEYHSGMSGEEEDYRDDYRMCQPVAYDSEDMSSYSESEGAVSSGDEFDREEELRGYNNRAIDFTLHTILEESCEDSEPDSAIISSSRASGGVGGRSSAGGGGAGAGRSGDPNGGGGGSHSDRKRRSDPSELEKYFFYGVGGGHLTEEMTESNIEESEYTEEDEEEDVDEAIGGHQGQRRPASGDKDTDLASSRLEKYFMSGFANVPDDEDEEEEEAEAAQQRGGVDGEEARRSLDVISDRGNTDDSGSVGSESDGDGQNGGAGAAGAVGGAASASGEKLATKKKKISRSSRGGNRDEAGHGEEDGGYNYHSSESEDGENSGSAFASGDGSFDTIKRKKNSKSRKQSSSNSNSLTDHGVKSDGERSESRRSSLANSEMLPSGQYPHLHHHRQGDGNDMDLKVYNASVTGMRSSPSTLSYQHAQRVARAEKGQQGAGRSADDKSQEKSLELSGAATANSASPLASCSSPQLPLLMAAGPPVRKHKSRDSGFVGSNDDLLRSEASASANNAATSSNSTTSLLLTTSSDDMQSRHGDGESSEGDQQQEGGATEMRAKPRLEKLSEASETNTEDDSEKSATALEAAVIGSNNKTTSGDVNETDGDDRRRDGKHNKMTGSAGPANLSRKDSFHQWSSDEETNLMMNRMRAFFRTMLANAFSQSAAGAGSEVSTEAEKPVQLLRLEERLTELMRTVPGINEAQVREIVEYLSSEEAWSDSYDSSDYTGSDWEQHTVANSLMMDNKGVDDECCISPPVNIPDIDAMAGIQDQISASCQEMRQKLVERQQHSSGHDSNTEAEFQKETAVIYQKLMSSMGQLASLSASQNENAAEVASSGEPKRSPPFASKLLQHISSRLVAIMHEVSAANSENSSLSSNDGSRSQHGSSSIKGTNSFRSSRGSAFKPVIGSSSAHEAPLVTSSPKFMLGSGQRGGRMDEADGHGKYTFDSVDSPKVLMSEHGESQFPSSRTNNPFKFSKTSSKSAEGLDTGLRRSSLEQKQESLLEDEDSSAFSVAHSSVGRDPSEDRLSAAGGATGLRTFLSSTAERRGSSSAVSDIADDERYSWKGSFESALAADSRTRLSIEAKRRSGGGSDYNSEVFSSAEHVDRRHLYKSNAANSPSSHTLERRAQKAAMSASRSEKELTMMTPTRELGHKYLDSDSDSASLNSSVSARYGRRSSVPDTTLASLSEAAAAPPPSIAANSVPRTNPTHNTTTTAGIVSVRYHSSSTNSLPRMGTSAIQKAKPAAGMGPGSSGAEVGPVSTVTVSIGSSEPSSAASSGSGAVRSARYRPNGYKPPPTRKISPANGGFLQPSSRKTSMESNYRFSNDEGELSSKSGTPSPMVQRMATTGSLFGSSSRSSNLDLRDYREGSVGRSVREGSAARSLREGSVGSSRGSSEAGVGAGIDAEDERIHPGAVLNKTSSLSSLGNRSESMASVCSQGEGRYGTVPVKGEIEFGFIYNFTTGSLDISIKQCRDLAPVDTKRNRSDPYVKVYLLPDRSKPGKRKTKVKKHTLNPLFEEILKFAMPVSEVERRTLWVSVWHSDMFGRNDFLGEVMLPMAGQAFDDPSSKWFILQDRSEPPEDETVINSKGDIIVALKFVPSSDSPVRKDKKKKGTLMLLVKEGKNLPVSRPNSLPDPYCKCYLLPDRAAKASKQKTAVCRRTTSPRWDQTMAWDQVSGSDLPQLGLEIGVWDHSSPALSAAATGAAGRLRDGAAGSNQHELLGGVRLNLGTGKFGGRPNPFLDASGKEVNLWQQMLDRPNFWVEGSLTLRDITVEMAAKTHHSN